MASALVVRIIMIIVLAIFFLSLSNVNDRNNITAQGSEKDKQQPSVGPLFGASSTVFVLQAADEAYASKMEAKMEANKKWARCMNYTYELKTLSKTGNIYTEKVEAINETLSVVAHENDWVVFLDGDVHFKGDSCNAVENMVPLESTDGEPCEILAMTSPVTINTGILLLKSSTAAKQLVRRWLELQEKPDKLLSFGAADQLTLQEAVMEKALGDSYTGNCLSMNSQASRNFCFRDNFPQEHRSTQQMCFIPCDDKNPIQCNDCGLECNRTIAPFHHDSKMERHYAKILQGN